MIKRELQIFLIVGTLTVLVDLCTYRSLLWTQLFSIDTAKGLGFITGTVFAYLANRFWTFGHKQHADGTLIRFLLLYSATLAANIIINSLVINLLNGFAWNLSAAFLIATGVSASLNFIGMKWFAFKEQHASP